MDAPTTTIPAVIIDDEQNSRDTLKALLAHYCPQVAVLAEAHTAEAGAMVVQQHQPQLLFLDVEMPLGSGFDLLNNLEGHQGQPFEVIFITAHDRYALQAIKMSALDYLLKPVSVSDLKAAVQKVATRQQQGQAPANEANPGLNVFFDNIKNLNNQLHKVVLPTQEGFDVVEVKDIVRCEADDNYTHIYLAGGPKLLVSRTLKEFEEMLHDKDFLRIHQSHLINAAHVQRYIKGRGGYVKMSDDSIIEVSRRKKDELMHRFLN